MSADRKNITWKESLKLNHRAYMLFYHKYPQMIISRMALIIWKALTPYVSIYFSSLVIGELSGNKNVKRIELLVILTLASAAGISFISALLEKWKNTRSAGMGLKIKGILCEKLFDLDYIKLDDPKTMELYSAIIQNLNGPGWGLYHVLPDYETMCQAVMRIAGGLFLTFSLFTSRIPESTGKYAMLNTPVFVIGMIGIMLLVALMSSVLAGKAGTFWAVNSAFHTLGNRLFFYYGGLEAIYTKLRMCVFTSRKKYAKGITEQRKSLGSEGMFASLCRGPVGLYCAASSAVSTVFTGIAYVFVCVKAWAGAFGIGAATRYITSVTRVYGGVSDCITSLEDMRNNASFLELTFEFLDIPNIMYQGSLTVEKRSDRKYEIEFKNVSFKYPGADYYALKNVNMKFEIGKKLAVVGMNGSGKTTFIKLLCRLYDPTEGEILLRN